MLKKLRNIYLNLLNLIPESGDIFEVIFKSSLPLPKKILFFSLYLKFTLKDYILVKSFKRRIRCERFLGYLVYFHDYSVFRILFNEIFLLKRYCSESAAASPLIIDCGAHIGIAVLFFKWLYPHSRIIAFEPHKENFAMLLKNIEVNHLTGIEPYNSAVLDKGGEASFYTDKREKSSMIGSLFCQRTHGRDLSKDKVCCVALSDFITQKVDFLKMDIEGAESVVIADLFGKQKLAFVNEMTIEYHHNLCNQGSGLSKFLAYLEGAGFDYTVLGLVKPYFPKAQYQDLIISAYRRSQQGR